MPLALEARISAGILLAGGLPTARARPEVTESNFAPRVTIPVLMINGRYDYIFPLESSQQVLFDLFATPADDKKHRLFETGHGVRSYRTAEIELEILSWLDRFLGVVN
jgi:pimeloyl-ACP methyl ester carboxylesterase